MFILNAGLDESTIDLTRKEFVAKPLAGRYRLQGLVGKGGMCEVYLARDITLGKLWAVKRQLPVGESCAQESVKDEATLLSSLSHPSLPMVVDFFQEDGFEHLVMEYCDGKTMADLLEQGPLPLADALDVIYQLSDVLHYLHNRVEPIIYRDLKPHNVIVSPTGKVKLIDFGIARARTGDTYKDTQALGTPGYAAPEQYGEGKSDQRTDIFGLGATLHHALTGLHPGRNPFSFPPITQFCPQFPLALEMLLDRAVSLKPDDRFQKVEDFVEALKRVCRHRDMQALLNPETVGEEDGQSVSLDLQIELKEKELQLEDTENRLEQMEATLQSLRQELSREKEKSRSLLAQQTVQDKSLSFELERARASMQLKSKEVEAEIAERRQLERVLSETRSSARNQEIKLLQYEEAFRKAGAESQRMLADRDSEIARLKEHCNKLEDYVGLAQERIQKTEAAFLEFTSSDEKLEISRRRSQELEEELFQFQALYQQSQRNYQSTCSQLDALRLEALTIIQAQKDGNEVEIPESLAAGGHPDLALTSLESAVSQLETALEESCRLWLRAEAKLEENTK